MSPRWRTWLAISVSIVLVGSIGSVLGAQAVARNDGQKAHQAAVTTSVEIASTLRLAIQHEQDLAVSSAAFFVGNPDATQAQFLQWTNSVRASRNTPNS